jgi:hypothetical protein
MKEAQMNAETTVSSLGCHLFQLSFLLRSQWATLCDSGCLPMTRIHFEEKHVGLQQFQPARPIL